MQPRLEAGAVAATPSPTLATEKLATRESGNTTTEEEGTEECLCQLIVFFYVSSL